MARTPGCSFPSPNLSPVLTLTSQMLQRQCTLNEGYETVDVPAESIRAAVGRKDCLLAKCDGSLLAYVQYQATLGYTTGRNELAFEGNNIERVMSIQSGMSLLDLEVGRSEIETYGSYGGRPERFLLRCDSLYPGSGNEGLKIDFGTNQYAFARLDFASRSARQSRSQASFRLVYWEVTGAEAESGDDGSRPVSSIHIFCGPSALNDERQKREVGESIRSLDLALSALSWAVVERRQIRHRPGLATMMGIYWDRSPNWQPCEGYTSHVRAKWERFT